jgi:hypothetical protein
MVIGIKHGIIFIAFLFVFQSGFSQLTRIKGRVRDAETGEPIPFANIYIKNSSVGCYTNDSGAYSIQFKGRYDSLSAAFLGYRPAAEKFKRHTSQIIDFNLYSNTTKLEDIIVIPGENPAHRILRNIWARKERNNNKSNNIQCKLYNKVQISLSNIDDKFKNKKILKPFQFVFDNIDTNAFTGKTYLPILISETVSDYYFQKKPSFEKTNVKATQISGIKNESVLSFVGGLNQSLNIYDDYMSFYSETGFISPIADAGLLFYRYYLLDSAKRNGHKCYRIKFKPRRKQERTFSGEFWVADTSFAIQSLNMRINPEANINFVSDLFAEYEYFPANDSVWLMSHEHIQSDLSLVESKNIKGLQGDRTNIYSNYILNKPIPDSILKSNEPFAFSDSVNNEQFWVQNRPVKLSVKEEKVYKMVDSIKNVPAFRTMYDILSTIFDAHYNFGKFKIGPYFSVYSYNKVEGHRFRIGGTTTAKLSENLKFTSYAAYGTLDKKFKYFANVIWVLKQSPRISLATTVRHDVSQVNRAPDELLNENILSSVLRRNPFEKLQMIDNFNTSLESDLMAGITNTLLFNYMRVYQSPFISITNALNKPLPFISTAEVGVGFHFESGQKFFSSKFKRLRLRNNNPAFDIKFVKSIKTSMGNQINYYRVNIGMKQFLNLGVFGFNRYAIEASKTFGRAPWPFLNVMRGNETYALDKTAFNMMNYYEFVADQLVTLVTEQHFQGIFFNYIPLLRKLKLREVVSAKAVAGKLNDKNTRDIILPTFMHKLDQPYIEIGVGIENIFKVIRIDAMWRLTHTKNTNIEIFGLRARLQFML